MNIDRKLQDRFIQGLMNDSLAQMCKIPKCDYHNHAGRGGRITYIEKLTGIEISRPPETFSSISDIDTWLNSNVNHYLPPGKLGYLQKIEATFVAAQNDGVVAIALNFGIGEVNVFGGIESFVNIIENLHLQYAKDIQLSPVLAIYDTNGLEKLEEILSYRWFNSIDLINYRSIFSLKEMQILSRLAKWYGLKVKAHIGEYGKAEDVLEYVEELQLDEIQHGIQIATSPLVMKRIAGYKTQLNLCPASNIALGICNGYKTYPIRIIYDYGVFFTINTDDLLIFNSSVSEQYLKLFKTGSIGTTELLSIWEKSMENVH